MPSDRSPRSLASRRSRILLALIAGVFGFLTLGASPAAAADTALVGAVIDGTADTGVPGVIIRVEGESFTGEATSGEDGSWSVVVPGGGSYRVFVDLTTLPEGLGFPDETRSDTTVLVFEGREKLVRFILGEGTGGGGASVWERIPQLAVDGLIFGIILALAAVGLSLVFGTTKLTNFAHGELIALGALLTYFFSSIVGLPLVLAAAVAVLASGFIGGWMQNRVLWRPLRRRGTGIIAAMIVSIGLGFLLRYFFLFIFGGQTRQFDEYAGQAGIAIGPVLVTPKDLISSTVGIILIGATTWWLLKTKSGKATRAVSDNPALASASGIEVEKVISTVWIFGAALAGFSGVMLGLQTGVSWQMGFTVLLLVFAGTVLGGLGTAFGAIVGSLLVGLLTQLSTLILPTELKYVGALLILIIILLVRPQGILGRAERVG